MLYLTGLVYYAGHFATEFDKPALIFLVKEDTEQSKPLHHYFWPWFSLIYGDVALPKQVFSENRLHIEISSSMSGEKGPTCYVLYIPVYFCLHLPLLSKICYAVNM